jgi:tRNA nucleotidyltransferase/poly(A) polymerase
MYEVTTFRRDVETDGRHAVVAFADSIEEDLGRRDFTINAVAWHPLREELLDPFGGAADLSSGILRTVGEPEDRFAEDYLRVLRGLRFAGRFGLEVEPPTWEALRAATPRLPDLSAERIRDELLKVLEADPMPSRALELYRRSGALRVLYPELEARSASPAWPGAVGTVDRLPRGRPLLRLAALLRGLDVPARDTAALLVRLRLSNVKTDDTAHRAGAPLPPGPDAPAAELRGWLATVGREHWRAVLRLELARARVQGDPRMVLALRRRLRDVLRSDPPLRVGELALDGRDLIRLGLRPGPRFGEILEALLEQVLEDPDRNRPDALRAEALRMVREAGDV